MLGIQDWGTINNNNVLWDNTSLKQPILSIIPSHQPQKWDFCLML